MTTLDKGVYYSSGYTIIYLNFQSSKVSGEIVLFTKIAKTMVSVKRIRSMKIKKYRYSRK